MFHTLAEPASYCLLLAIAENPGMLIINNETYILEKTQLNSRHETRDTRQEDNLYDSVCDVMRFRIFSEIFV